MAKKRYIIVEEIPEEAAGAGCGLVGLVIIVLAVLYFMPQSCKNNSSSYNNAGTNNATTDVAPTKTYITDTKDNTITTDIGSDSVDIPKHSSKASAAPRHHHKEVIQDNAENTQTTDL